MNKVGRKRGGLGAPHGKLRKLDRRQGIVLGVGELAPLLEGKKLKIFRLKDKGCLPWETWACRINGMGGRDANWAGWLLCDCGGGGIGGVG